MMFDLTGKTALVTGASVGMPEDVAAFKTARTK